MKEIDGDLIKLALKGEFDVIVHGCNCFCTMGAGIAPQMARAFYCDRYSLERPEQKGNIDKLGRIEANSIFVYNNRVIASELLDNYDRIIMSREDGDKQVFVVNAYTQYDYKGEKPLDYAAINMCFKKLNHIFKGKHIGMPKIGCGLAGGDWEIVSNQINKLFTQCPVTIVNYKP